MSADIVIRGAKILTMDPKSPEAQALAIKDGRVVFVGSNADVSRYVGPATQTVDGAGRTVVPGFVEAHLHLFAGGAELNNLQLLGVRGFEKVRELVRKYADENPDDKVLFAQGADYTTISQTERINRHHLDAMVPDRPLALFCFDHHTMWANTKALEAVGLLHGARLGPGNEIVMGEDGLATGELRESEAYGPLIRYSGKDRAILGLATGGEPDPQPTPEQREADREMIRQGLAWCARHGITSIHNMDGNFYTLELLSEIEQEGGLLCRVKVPFHFKNFMTLDMLDKASAMTERYQTDWLSSGLVKLFFDGVMESYTGYMVDDYADRPGYRGEPLFTQESFNAIVCEADRRGLQIAVHSCGDGAVRSVLDGYEAARRANGPRDSRHRVEHIEVITEADVPRFAQLGAIASMQPSHPPGVMDFPLEPGLSRIGRARWPLSYAWRTLKDAGAHVVFASDWPVADISVLAGIQAAAMRKRWAETDPDQSFGVLESLAAYTVEGAYAEFSEDRKGMLKAGYFADVVMLSTDLEETALTEIRQVRPVLTICGGRVTYQDL